MWETTLGAADAVLSSNSRRRRPQPWARWLLTVEEPTVLGHHLQVWLSPYAVLPVSIATRASALNMVRDLLPAGGGDTWQNKLARSGLALRNAFIRKSHHEQILGEDARRPPRRERY